LYKLKRYVAARHAQLWWDYPPCRPAPNIHTYFTILQIVESAFCTSLSFIKKALVNETPEITIYAAFRIHDVSAGIIYLVWVESSGLTKESPK